MTHPKEQSISPIRNGTVIDHIACSQALRVIRILQIDENNLNSRVSIGMHVYSDTLGGLKDIIKIENMELTEEIVDKIALVAPDATISIIRDYNVTEKYKVELEDRVTGLARCSNPNCITNKGEPIKTRFTVISKHPVQLRCEYCDRILNNISDNLL